VQLPFRRPADVEPLRRVLSAPLTFDADRLTVSFHASDLPEPIGTADPVLYAMMSERVASLESMLGAGVVERARDLLRRLVFLHDAGGSAVASRLGVSLRTLKRRLKDQGASLQGLRDEVRSEAARQLLEHTGKPAGEIAVILGYADASAFTRAFRRWHDGMTPTQWRARGDAGRSRRSRGAAG
jgi:AraC-like DNA-binding protein